MSRPRPFRVWASHSSLHGMNIHGTYGIKENAIAEAKRIFGVYVSHFTGPCRRVMAEDKRTGEIVYDSDDD